MFCVGVLGYQYPRSSIRKGSADPSNAALRILKGLFLEYAETSHFSSYTKKMFIVLELMLRLDPAAASASSQPCTFLPSQ